MPVARGRWRLSALVALAALAASSAAAPAVGAAGWARSATAGPRAGGPHQPTVRVLLLGDSTAFTLGIGLAAHEKAYGVDEDNGAMLGCGIAQGAHVEVTGVVQSVDQHCDGGTASEQWPDLWRGLIAQFRPNVVMVLVGRWEVVNRTYRGRWTNILDPAYAAYLRGQLREADAVARSDGASVVLLTAPCYDPPRQHDGRPWPEDDPRRLAVFNGLVRQVAGTSPHTSLLDFNAMACPAGRYQADVDGVPVRYDGVHFTLGGGVVFGSRIWPAVATLGRRQQG